MRKIVDVHTFSKEFNIKIINSKWLSDSLGTSLQENLDLKINDIHVKVVRKWNTNVSVSMAHRERVKASILVEGSFKDQFRRIYDYAHELLRSNPGSTIKVKVDDVDGDIGKRRGTMWWWQRNRIRVWKRSEKVHSFSLVLWYVDDICVCKVSMLGLYWNKGCLIPAYCSCDLLHPLKLVWLSFVFVLFFMLLFLPLLCFCYYAVCSCFAPLFKCKLRVLPCHYCAQLCPISDALQKGTTNSKDYNLFLLGLKVRYNIKQIIF